uniref:Alpha-taxilin n=1 Tax=Oryza barthii TaxID=65489 RepID=A0A0D3FH61_9ORYZ
MEGSPATRLPEADSLPDGFVESSAADQAPPPPADAGDPASRSLGLDQADATVGGGGGGDETLGAPPSTLASVAQDTLDAYSAADALQSLTVGGSAAEPERALGEPAGDAGDAKESSKESSVVEQVESMADQKVVIAEGSGEQKRKVVKKSKVEKDRELFELAQAYHKEECRRVSTEGQNMRMELSDKFNNAIKDVSVKLDEQKNECIAQLEENNLLRSKLKDLADQYNITQQKYAHQLKEKMLELELADLKMQQHQEKTAQEQTQMQLYADQVSQLMSTEKNLRLQLAADGERFQQFQDALTKSNEVFETYKKEMEKMVKLIKDLKKDNEFMKSKCENSDVALVKLIEERELMKKQVDKFKNQKEKLESLCRSLQAERKQSPSGGTPDATSNETNLATIES